MERAYELIRDIELLMFVVLAVSAVVHWARRRDTSSAWLAATFMTISLVIVAGRILPADPTTPVLRWLEKLTVAVAILFPYCLWRFMVTIIGRVRWRWITAHVLTGALLVWVLALPDIPETGDVRPPAFIAFIVVLLIQWVFLSSLVAVRLWLAGRGLPTVARRRMRTISLGATGMAVAIVLAGTASSARIGVEQVLIQLLVLASAPLFLLGFAPPAIVRWAWRRREEAELRQAEIALMEAKDRASVAAVLLPHVARLVGGRGAALVGADGRVIGASGLSAEEAAALVAPRPNDEASARLASVPLREGSLLVTMSPYTPFFGQEEMDLLRGLAAVADLALARADLVAELSRSNRDLESFAYIASHDLQEPLRVVASYVQLLERRYAERLDQDAKDFIAFAVDGVERMQHLINDLLAYARVESEGKAAVPTDASTAARQAADNLRTRVEESGATIDVGDLPTVRADPGQLVQLFQNLIGNAIKFRGTEAPVVRVRAEHLDGVWRFAVADNGIGIDPTYAERVFTIFQRLHGRNSYPGTGIGLSICKRIVERHGGSIWVESREGEGATFYFTLSDVGAA